MLEFYFFLCVMTATVSYRATGLHIKVDYNGSNAQNSTAIGAIRTSSSGNQKVKWQLPVRIYQPPTNKPGWSPLNRKPLHRFRRQAEESRPSMTLTCDLFLRSDQFLWDYVKNRHKFRQQYGETELEIMDIFKRNVNFLNKVYDTNITTYDNRIKFNGIKFTIAKTEILKECSPDQYSFCDPSLTQESLVKQLANYSSGHCLMFLFTYRNWKDRYVDALAFQSGICQQGSNAGFVNLRKSERLIPFMFAHEIGHLIGSPHDRGSPCFNDAPDPVRGNYLMSPFSLNLGKAEKERATQLSPCSKDNISRYLDDVINERRNINNCLQVEVLNNVEDTPSADPSKRDSSHWWVVGVASVSLLVCVSLAVAIPFVLWKKRVTFIMKLVYRFKMYEDNDVREFDAFISYKSTEKDEHFVVHTLFPKLEKEFGFKICVHFRDFVPGETISNNIIWAVENSRRTILVLSPSYVESEFCQFEYQKAQHEMLKQKQRIIPIVYQDISQVRAQMDPTLRTILNSITYIEWPNSSDQSKVDKFWEMLSLSMPKLSGTRTSLCVVNGNVSS